MKPTLIIGASTDPNRTVHYAIQKLRQEDIPVYALGKKEGQVGDVSIFTSLDELTLQDVHTVSLYINPSHQVEYYDKIIQLKPKRVVFNPGTENPAFAKMLEDNDIEATSSCTLVMLSLANY